MPQIVGSVRNYIAMLFKSNFGEITNTCSVNITFHYATADTLSKTRLEDLEGFIHFSFVFDDTPNVEGWITLP